MARHMLQSRNSNKRFMQMKITGMVALLGMMFGLDIMQQSWVDAKLVTEP